jgi:outer membrane protein assembly factor BamB
VTASERDGAHATQARLLVDVSTPWSQLGADAGRSGRSSLDVGLWADAIGDLREVWRRDLEVLGTGEEILVTDVAGEVATPAIVVGDLLISTWRATDVMRGADIFRRVALTATDVLTGRVLWRRVAESTVWEDLSFGAPVLANGMVVIRWDGDRTLLGLESATGEVRWRRAAGDRERFGELLVSEDRVILPVDRVEDDALVAVDPRDGTLIWEAALPGTGSERRLAAEDGLVSVTGDDRVIGIDMSDGAVVWTRDVPLGWWGRPLTADGLVFLPTYRALAKTVTALDVGNGRPAWTWSAWPGGKCGSGCSAVWSMPAAAADGLLLVTSAARFCPPGQPSVECEASPSYRSLVTALDSATGDVLWTHAFTELVGEIAIVDDLVVVQSSTLSLLSLHRGRGVGAIPAPERPGTLGAQHTWAGQPIPTGPRLVVGAADGSITAFSVVTAVPRPRPGALTPDLTLPVPTPAPSALPTGSRAPAPSEGDGRIVGLLVVVTVSLLVAGLLMAALVRRNRRVPGEVSRTSERVVPPGDRSEVPP